MNKDTDKQNSVKTVNGVLKHTKEIKYQESPIEKALKLGCSEVIAHAIRSIIDKDRIN